MMHHRNQHMLVIRNAEKPCPQRYIGRQIKRIMRCRPDCLLQITCRPPGGIDDAPPDIDPSGLDYHLLRNTCRSHEHCPQTLVTIHHIGQRHTQRLDIQPSIEPHRDRHVVYR
jgi:hypothetical protein